MSWGYRILFAYAAGVIFISAFVYKAMQVQTDLSEENYYEQELKFNDFATSRENGREADSKVMIKAEQGFLYLDVHPSLASRMQAPLIELYYPANKAYDKKIKLPIPVQVRNSLSIKELHAGACLLRLKFTVAGVPYFIERPLMIIHG